jgi:hypothetical protein
MAAVRMAGSACSIARPTIDDWWAAHYRYTVGSRGGSSSQEVTATASHWGRGGRAGKTVLAVGDLQPPGEAGLRDSEAPRHLSAGLLALPRYRDDVATELLRDRLGHDADPSSEAVASQARSQPKPGRPESELSVPNLDPNRLGQAGMKYHVLCDRNRLWLHRAGYRADAHDVSTGWL